MLLLQRSFILHEPPSGPGCSSLMCFYTYFKQLFDASAGFLVAFLYSVITLPE